MNGSVLLRGEGDEDLRLNASYMEAVLGRMSDVKTEWIAHLLEYGLLAPSFVPPSPIDG